MEILNNKKCFLKGGRKKGSINNFNSYLYKEKEFRTLTCLRIYIKCSRIYLYELMLKDEIIIIQ